jgi:hypothetical protein
VDCFVDPERRAKINISKAKRHRRTHRKVLQWP